VASLGLTTRFSRGDERSSESLTLTSRIDREHPEVAAFVAQLDVDAASECPRRILQHQELAVLHSPENIGCIRAIASYKKIFDAIGERDERRDRFSLVSP
jgi:hypothetical protein